MDSIITNQETNLKSNTIHEHNNPFDVSLFSDNAKIKRIDLLLMMKMKMELVIKLSLKDIQVYLMKAWVRFYNLDQ